MRSAFACTVQTHTHTPHGSKLQTAINRTWSKKQTKTTTLKFRPTESCKEHSTRQKVASASQIAIHSEILPGPVSKMMSEKHGKKNIISA